MILQKSKAFEGNGSMAKLLLLKRTVSRDGFGFWWRVWLVRSLNRSRGHLLNFLAAQMIYKTKSVFLAVNASLRWLNNAVGVHLVQVSLLLIGQQCLIDFFRYRLLLPIGWRIVQILRRRRRETTNTAQTIYYYFNTSSKPIHFCQYIIILILSKAKSISWDSPLNKIFS